MAKKFRWQKFRDTDLSDTFFDSLKNDYEEFSDWFRRKSESGDNALVLNDEDGISAFIYLKREEDEPIELTDKILPAAPRLKIGTLRLAERFRGRRFGEGALGVSLWYWRETKLQDVYVTVFEKHSELINLFERFGFTCVGKNKRGECVYLKSRLNIDYSNPYKAFPFINSNFAKAGLLPINEEFHDRLFPYSELKGVKNEIEAETAGNGITKVYIGTPGSSMQYEVGEPVVIYRIHTGQGQKTFLSAITSYCTITKVEIVKQNGQKNMELQEFIEQAGNKTVFSTPELIEIYRKENVVMLELVYNGYFGKGHNTNHKRLKEMGMFNTYPYQIEYTQEQFITILKECAIDVQNVIIN